jgi:hypothetical protein
MGTEAMSKFTDILKNTLSHVQSNYDLALKDFRELVSELADAVRQLSEEKRDLRVGEESKDAAQTVMSVYVTQPGMGDTIVARVGDYAIPASGYPISYGQQTPFGKFEKMGSLDNRGRLEKHFADMLANPTSPIVVQIAFALRKK